MSTDQESTVDAQGARVTSVMEDGPAAAAGLRVGDVITRVDGQSLLERKASLNPKQTLDAAVQVAEGFWWPRLETNRQVTVWYDFGKCEDTGRIANFEVAGGLASFTTMSEGELSSTS